jgi:hypothetical protein
MLVHMQARCKRVIRKTKLRFKFLPDQTLMPSSRASSLAAEVRLRIHCSSAWRNSAMLFGPSACKSLLDASRPISLSYRIWRRTAKNGA